MVAKSLLQSYFFISPEAQRISQFQDFNTELGKSCPLRNELLLLHQPYIASSKDWRSCHRGTVALVTGQGLFHSGPLQATVLLTRDRWSVDAWEDLHGRWWYLRQRWTDQPIFSIHYEFRGRRIRYCLLQFRFPPRLCMYSHWIPVQTHFCQHLIHVRANSVFFNVSCPLLANGLCWSYVATTPLLSIVVTRRA